MNISDNTPKENLEEIDTSVLVIARNIFKMIEENIKNEEFPILSNPRFGISVDELQKEIDRIDVELLSRGHQ